MRSELPKRKEERKKRNVAKENQFTWAVLIFHSLDWVQARSSHCRLLWGTISTNQ